MMFMRLSLEIILPFHVSLYLSAPGFNGLIFKILYKRLEFLMLIPCFKCCIVSFSVFLMDDYGRMIEQYQQVIHEQSSSSAVSVGKGMYILKFCMKICGCGESVIMRYAIKFIQ